ncbi:FISUMP domain-containing protein [Bacteroidota bacterium]
MKKLFIMLIIILAHLLNISSAFAQVPQSFNYQTVVRDGQGEILPNKSVSFRISLIQGGTTVHIETFNKTTNEFGLVNLKIGSGNENVDWSAGTVSLKVEFDPDGGTNYSITGNSELLSVPYAIYAENSRNDDNINLSSPNKIGDITPNSGAFTTLSSTGATTLGDNPLGPVAIYGSLRIVTGNPGTGKILTSDQIGNATWENGSSLGALLIDNNLSDLKNNATAKTNLGLNNVENIAISTWTGSSNINNLGTITTLDVSGSTTLDGAVTLGDAESDAITISGALKITSGIPGVDKVLTSDVSGNVRWSTFPGGGTVPVYTSAEIIALTPTLGDAVFNRTDNTYQIYSGSEWIFFSSACWPQPTYANAGTDQSFHDGTTTATLSANTPVDQHGTGAWSIISGTGGNFTDSNNPNTTFSGNGCETYVLRWQITTTCSSSVDNMNIEFGQTPTTADAGTYQIFNDGTTTATIAANTPEAQHGTGVWSIISGTGGNFTDSNNPNTTFSGQLNERYILRWTITTNCSSSIDEVIIIFAQDGVGNTLTDIDDNNYNTVWIGGQLWMAENLKVTKEADGSAIPTVSDLNISGSSDDEWEALLYTDKAYCYYNDTAVNEAYIYGALYTYEAALGACPEGWHLPTSVEWTSLTDYIAADGHSGTEGTALKSTNGWINNGNGTDDYGFSILPAGGRLFVGVHFIDINSSAWLWTSTEHISETNIAWNISMHFSREEVNNGDNNGYKNFGLSVRCIKDD